MLKNYRPFEIISNQILQEKLFMTIKNHCLNKKHNQKEYILLCKQKKRKLYDIYLKELESNTIEFNLKILLIMNMMD